jgi:hypothetical protein
MAHTGVAKLKKISARFYETAADDGLFGIGC